MINGNKIIFVLSPGSAMKNWMIDNATTLFDIKENDKKILFRFGSPARMDIAALRSPYPRMKLTIEEHLEHFKDTKLIYFGMNVVDFCEELYNDYPESDFGIMVLRNRVKDNLVERLLLGTDNLVPEEMVKEKVVEQFDKIDLFLQSKNYNRLDISPREPNTQLHKSKTNPNIKGMYYVSRSSN